MPLSPRFSSPCLQISKSPPNLRKPSFLWAATCTATQLNPNKSKAMTTTLMWSNTEARTQSCCGVMGTGGCQPQRRGVRVLFCACGVWQRTKEILILYRFCSVQARPSLHFASKPPQPSDLILFPKKPRFCLLEAKGTNTPARISSGSWCCGQLWCSRGSGVFSISFELLMQILALFSM